MVWSRGVMTVVAAMVLVLASTHAQEGAPETYWPQWRGPLATGVTPDGIPPVHWSKEENIRWKVRIPGRGSASPIVWDDKVFVLTAVGHRRTGLRTRRSVFPTPATDRGRDRGERGAAFHGSRVLSP